MIKTLNTFQDIMSARKNLRKSVKVKYGLEEAVTRGILFCQAYSGRYLFLVLRALGKGVFRPITARDMTDGEKRLFKRKVKKT